MNLRNKNGSITIFVLVGLLFMSAFLVISYASNVNRSKIAEEQLNIISGIYSKGNDEESYTDAYTDLRKKNARIFSFENEADADKTIFENTNTVELRKTFDGNFNNYRIYGNSVQNRDPSPQTPVEIQSLGDLVTDITDENNGKYRVSIKLTNENGESIQHNIYLDEPLRKVGEYMDCIDFKNQKISRIIKQGQIDSNTGIAKFDGVTNYSAFYFSKSDLLGYEVIGNTFNVPIIANTFKYQKCSTANTNSRWTEDYQIGGSVSQTYKRICFTLPNTIANIEEAKEWFVNNPITYYYPSNEVVETPIEIPKLEVFEDYTKIEVLTDVAPSKIEVEYTGYTI